MATIATPAAEYSRLRTTWSPQMQAICDRYDDRMHGHYEWLVQQVVQFQQDKACLLEALRHEAASDAVADAAIGDMMPASLQRLLALLVVDREPVEEGTVQRPKTRMAQVFQKRHGKQLVLPPTPADTPSPCKNPFRVAADRLCHQAQPVQPAREVKAVEAVKPAKPVKPVKTVRPVLTAFVKAEQQASNAITAPPWPSHKKSTTKRAKRPLFKYKYHGMPWITTPPAPKEPRLAPRRPPIDDWEVEATEFVFEYAPFGPGWFVLRCERGMELSPVVFTAYPLRKSGRTLGLTHFNDSSCKHHKHKTYTDETMMVAHAQRVVDDNDRDVTEHWAAASNEHLTENAERRERRRTRRREQITTRRCSQKTTRRHVAVPRGRVHIKAEQVEEASRSLSSIYPADLVIDDDDDDDADGDYFELTDSLNEEDNSCETSDLLGDSSDGEI